MAKVASVRTQHASDLVINPWIITYFLALNTRFAPFDDVRVRQALNFAVDRTRLLDLAFGPGLGQRHLPGSASGPPRVPTATALTPSSPNSTGTWTAPDLARARQLVRASGTAGQPVTVWLAKLIPTSARPLLVVERPRPGSQLDAAYMPIAWYPLSTYSVVPVTFLASSPSR